MAAPSTPGLIAALDIGTAKTCCLIARVDANGRIRVLGTSNKASDGVRNGAIVDIDAASHCVGAVVEAAERMARETVERVIVNISTGQIASRQYQTTIPMNGGQIGTAELNQVLAKNRAEIPTDGLEVLHFLPLGYGVDGNRGIRDPRGLFGQSLALESVAITCLDSATRTMRTTIGRAHLKSQNIVASAFSAGLAVLNTQEIELGATVIDMGAGSTNIGIFYENELIFCDSIPYGGGHITHDIAHGLGTPLTYAERLKTLQGSCLAAASDDRDMLDIKPLGPDEENEVPQAPRSFLVQIIQARVEEILEMVRARIEASPARRFSGGAVVLTGGASQLHGLRELTGQMLDKRVRIGRPGGVAGLAELSESPAFASAVGLLLYAQRQHTSAVLVGEGNNGARTGMFTRLFGWTKRLT